MQGGFWANRAERRLRTYPSRAKGTSEKERETTLRRSSERGEAAATKFSQALAAERARVVERLPEVLRGAR